ncbi:hypothetical protein [Viridibacillus arvi]|uniref:hypothetical protein n=1 Tax=Viridibacillus arvi TaxID=263475 RepID=UPI0036F04700
MKKKKTLFTIAGALLVLSISFAGSAGASLPHHLGDGGGGVAPPKCDSKGNCPIRP